MGSPPPMRGKADTSGAYTATCRITPAHAGKSSCSQSVRVGYEDHPRPCGEKAFVAIIDTNNMGSPPPMRGKVTKAPAYVSLTGITPAHAGKSAAAHNVGICSQDHPRPCGEKIPAQSKTRGALGSPPPMRGKAGPVRRLTLPPGITPAHAGKSRQGNNIWPCAQDHPRPCGEKATARWF